MKTKNKFYFALIFLFILNYINCESSIKKNLNTNNSAELTQFQKQILAELNFVRTEPKKYAKEILTPKLKYFNGKKYTEPGKNTVLTYEGTKSLRECIRHLNAITPRKKLAFEKGLNLSAQWLADDQAKTGKTGHRGSDGSKIAQRITRYGTWKTYCAENCAYGYTNPRTIVSQLLIDDGIPSRGHRKNILNPKLKKVGIGFSNKNKAPYGAVTVMDFAEIYTSN